MNNSEEQEDSYSEEEEEESGGDSNSPVSEEPVTKPKPPTITITKPNFLRPSKLVVSSSLTSPGPSTSTKDNKEEQDKKFLPLTKELEQYKNGSKNDSPKSTKSTNNETFTFGENCSDRVSNERKRKLEDLENHEQDCKVPNLEDVELCTGEEGEANVVQFNCRLYTFEHGNWAERSSRATLRLNDCKELTSRLIIRTQGSFRLMLNTKIFNGMVVERPNDKSVKFTGMGSGSGSDKVRVFLVMGTHTDMELLHSALEQRLAQFKNQ